MITFISITSPDKEVTELFENVRHRFPYKINKPLNEQLSWYVKSSHFYKVFYGNEFIGCIFFDNWEDKTVNMGGFSKRKKLKQNIEAIRQLCSYYEEHTGFKIKAETKYKEAKICLLKAGFTKASERIFIYER